MYKQPLKNHQSLLPLRYFFMSPSLHLFVKSSAKSIRISCFDLIRLSIVPEVVTLIHFHMQIPFRRLGRMKLNYFIFPNVNAPFPPFSRTLEKLKKIMLFFRNKVRNKVRKIAEFIFFPKIRGLSGLTSNVD